MTENLQIFLYIISISITLIVSFIWWKNYTQKKWNSNEEYLKNIPRINETFWKEKISRMSGVSSVKTIFHEKRNNFNIFRIIITNNSKEIDQTTDIEILYKEKIEKKSLSLFATGIFGFTAM